MENSNSKLMEYFRLDQFHFGQKSFLSNLAIPKQRILIYCEQCTNYFYYEITFTLIIKRKTSITKPMKFNAK
jgi:hypothetical protein